MKIRNKSRAKGIKLVKIEPEGRGFNVVIINDHNQSIRPLKGLPLREALTEASDWADFFGAKLEDYHVAGKPVRVVTRDTYKDSVPKTAEQLLDEYRKPTGELNWNKMMHWESERFRGVHQNKIKLAEWLLPFYITGPIQPDWLEANCQGVWLTSSGGYRFSDDRDATLYKLFFGGA